MTPGLAGQDGGIGSGIALVGYASFGVGAVVGAGVGHVVGKRYHKRNGAIYGAIFGLAGAYGAWRLMVARASAEHDRKEAELEAAEKAKCQADPYQSGCPIALDCMYGHPNDPKCSKIHCRPGQVLQFPNKPWSRDNRCFTPSFSCGLTPNDPRCKQ